ncbi:MAG: TonB-dependent receptor [Spirochaetaceae bacterium]|nr:MAG: TonB-dependent receptor [Spirochaetaceae bacterium]
MNVTPVGTVRTLITFAVMVCAVPMSAGAEEKVVAEPITVIITAPAPDRGARPGVLVIDASTARQRGDRTVADALERAPGVVIQRTGSRFEPVTVRLRGSSAEQVLVLVDGRRLSDSRSGLVDLARMSLEGVDRVEITQGPSTALHGVGGAAGTINIISSRQHAPSAEWAGLGRLTVGSLGEQRAALSLDRGLESGSVSISVSGVTSRNSYSYERNGETIQRVNAGGTEGSVGVGGEWIMPGALLERIALDVDAHISDRGSPGTIEFPSENGRLVDQGGDASLRLDLQPAFVFSLQFPVEASVGVRERSFADPDLVVGESEQLATLTTFAASVAPQIDWNRLSVAVPLEWNGEWLDDSGLDQRSRATIALAPRAYWEGAQLDGEAAGRVEAVLPNDDQSITRLLPSGRLGVGWTLPLQRARGANATRAAVPLRLGMVGATGYRLPTFSELFWPAGPFAVGDPGLDPEYSVGAEIEIRVGFETATHLRVSGFWTEYQNLIQWWPGPDQRWRPRNTGDARVLGVEASSQLLVPLGLSPWTTAATMHAAAISATDQSSGVTNGKQLPYRARAQGGFGANLRHEAGYRFDLSTRWVGARPVTAQNTVWIDPYITIDAALVVPLSPRGSESSRVSAALIGSVHNLLDQPFVDTRFQPNPGREVTLGMEVRW